MAYIKRKKTSPKGKNQKISAEHSGGIPTNKEKAEKLLKEIKASQKGYQIKLVQIDNKTWKEVKEYVERPLPE